MSNQRGYSFGTFGGVFTPSILTIIGVIMYLRFGWILGHLGLAMTLLTVTLGSAITFVTGMAISALATNMRVKAGGAYFLISRSLGVEIGAAIGILLFAAQSVAVSFYSAGFVEALVPVVRDLFGAAPDPRILVAATIVGLGALASLNASLAIKAQYFIMACIGLSLLSFAFGRPPSLSPEEAAEVMDAAQSVRQLGYWAVFAVFFPAVTGILAGVGMSGDLRDPGKAIPRGTLASVVVGWAIYMSVPILFSRFAKGELGQALLLTDMDLFAKCARVRALVLLGVWAATLSSALGCFLSAPRTLQALAQDHVVPRFLGRGFGKTNDPVFSSAVTLAVALACSLVGKIDVLAPVLTMIHLAAYMMLNFSAAFETFMGNPAWRPAFHAPAWILFAGGLGCAGVMFMIGPGQAILAIALVVAIYWLMARRALRARWGDMRDGLAAMLVRIAVRRLSRSQDAGRVHNWRPNLLVFAAGPSKHSSIIELADDISRNRSLVTVASIVPASFWTARRAAELREKVERTLRAQRVEACVRIESSADLWTGAAEMVRGYGFGPIVPNTILVGMPRHDEGFAGLAGLAMAVSERRRNLVILKDVSPGVEDGVEASERLTGRIDIWWRGRYQNGGFMLALAWLVTRHAEKGTTIRLCRICGTGEKDEKVAEGLRRFLEEARVEAEVLVLSPDGRTAFTRIAEASRDAGVVLIGLPPPQLFAKGEGDVVSRFAKALEALDAGAAALPRALFVLAAEDVDFSGIFDD